jgi:hypothetical protein
MAVAYVIFMEKTNDIVVNLDAIILFKTSSSALIMVLKKKSVNVMNAPTELFLMAIAEDMVVVNAQSLDVTDP